MIFFRVRTLSLFCLLSVAWAIALTYSVQIGVAAFHENLHRAEKHASKTNGAAALVDSQCPLCDAIAFSATPVLIVDSLLTHQAWGTHVFTAGGSCHSNRVDTSFLARAPPAT